MITPVFSTLNDEEAIQRADAFAATIAMAKGIYVPDWTRSKFLAIVDDVATAMDHFYKPDRLNRQDGTRERLIADRTLELVSHGFACVASFHDSVIGEAVYLRRVDKGLIVFYLPSCDRGH
ncbi:hypothetical protein DBB29_24935 [Pandoraea cepalis]|uniref:Uncharacterized protein n=1 Tax=Pandoraea cepalis TaxID=2508294 RepID=A0AAW7MGQ9_9BURK|nr:hypothetical protein [Pandoraea cepalis]MDN4571908.1 hypothetical protein [Pandoraea cepalis]MDN4581362.1 hypothetical protein [Pandoraea cepalis]